MHLALLPLLQRLPSDLRCQWFVLRVTAGLAATATALAQPSTPVAADRSSLSADSEIRIAAAQPGTLTIDWPVDNTGARAEVVLQFARERPLIASIGWRALAGGPVRKIAEHLTPLTVLTVGERDLSRNQWMVFFDKVQNRPSRRFPARLMPSAVRARSSRTRAHVVIEGLAAGAFSGHFELTFLAGSPLIMAEAVLQTSEPSRAIIFDAGLVSTPGQLARYVWTDPRNGAQAAPSDTPGGVRAARFRAVAAEFDGGSIAVFPSPHRFLYPLDFADNFGFNWLGRHYDTGAPGDGFGVRQPPVGDNRFVPWVNAPPGTTQRLEVFYCVNPGDGAAAIETVKRYTRSDRFAALPGYLTFTSHYHVEHTLDLMKRQAAAGNTGLPAELREPGFVRALRGAGVDIVHLAEFHNGQTPKLATAERLRQVRLMHAECARLSDEKFLLLPGEEPNVHLGGHWISFFPKPVLWVLNRPAGTPFVQQTPAGETVYHVGSPADIHELMTRENGLMWTAHARIKSSIAFPDAYRETDFFKSPHFLGAAWKAMPADYSRDTLGWRVLDLLGDMSNWGADKRVLGEVDVFKIEPHYELYGHMNINYLKLGRMPRFADGWQPVLEVLRRGEFFVTTGEILLPEVKIERTSRGLRVRASVQGTFPLRFAEIVSGDGEKTQRHRIDLQHVKEFSAVEIDETPPAAGAKWARLEVWDIAANGAFTQPVRLN